MVEALVVVPTYNERENIERLLRSLLGLPLNLAVLVVDDNSPDGTGAIADQIAEREPRVRVIHRQGKLAREIERPGFLRRFRTGRGAWAGKSLHGIELRARHGETKAEPVEALRQDIGAMPGAVHPASMQLLDPHPIRLAVAALGDVFGHETGDAPGCDIPVPDRLSGRRYVREVASAGHVLGMPLRGLCQRRIALERGKAFILARLVDERQGVQTQRVQRFGRAHRRDHRRQDQDQAEDQKPTRHHRRPGSWPDLPIQDRDPKRANLDPCATPVASRKIPA